MKRRLILLSLGPICYLVFLVLRWLPGLAVFYNKAISPTITTVVSTVTGFVPFTVGELLVLALVGWYVISGISAIKHVVSRQRQLKNAIACGMLKLGGDIGLVVSLFYILWGFNYAVPPLTQQLGWGELGEVTAEELADLVVETSALTNAAYLEIHGEVDAGTPTTLPDNSEELERSILEGWHRAREQLDLPSGGPWRGPVKTPIFTGFYEWLGIAGFYFPYTGEANVRSGIPAIDYPKILAHEISHQRGVTQESEANFWGFMAAVHSDDPLARYSAFRFANRQMVFELSRVDMNTALNMSRRRLPGVQRDIEFARTYWRQFEGPGTQIGSSMNNAFLRTNRVEGGVRSYSMSSRLFLSYARSRGGSLLPGDAGANESGN